MPPEAVEILALVTDFFEGDAAKAHRWMHAVNPMLGGVTPLSMINSNRTEKLKMFIDSQLDEHGGADSIGC